MSRFQYDEQEFQNAQEFILNIIDQEGNLTNRISTNVVLKNPYELRINDFLPNTTPLTLNEFFSTCSNLITDSQLKSGIIENKLVKLVEEYPPTSMAEYGDEVITYKVVSRRPGMMNRDATGRPVRKSTYSYETQIVDEPNKNIFVESRPVDHIVEFTCWAKTNKLANSRAIWLEKLLVNNSYVFEIKGAERFFWEERTADGFEDIENQRLYYRPIRFFLRFREFDMKAYSIIRQFNINVSKA